VSGAEHDPVGLLVDPARVAELVGAPVVTVRLRHKPGVSTVAALSTPEGAAWGWLQLTSSEAAAKVANAARRARDRGRPLQVRPLADGGAATFGPVATDPRLHRALDELPAPVVRALEGPGNGRPTAPGVAGDGEEVTVLRHNPLRRLVVRRGETVLRLTEDHQHGAHRAARALHAAGVPVPRPVRADDVSPGRRVTAWSWAQGHDLHACPDADAARAAGRAIARWHATSPTADVARGTRRPAQSLHTVADGLRPVASALADRVERLLDDVVTALNGPQHAVWSHGDFSADQVVHRPDGEVEVIDLDRTCLAPAGLDLGSFAAVELLRTPEGAGPVDLLPTLLEGYAGDVDDAALAGWTAYGLLLRAAEPLRRARPTWRTDVAVRLDLTEEVLGRGLPRA
jgi:aminoglycoside phosphotransferase (APT) family kinase protein